VQYNETMSKWLGLAVLVALASGCYSKSEAFPCTTDDQCGPAGRCELSFGNVCSFPNANCPSGRAFGTLGGGQSDQCVGDSQQQHDGGVDVPIDSPPIDSPPIDALVCYGTGIVKVCFASAPTDPQTFSDQTLDTDDPAMCATAATGGNGYCVVVATTIMVNGTLRAAGSKPLVLIASDSLTIAGGGLIDASSRRSRAVGAPEKGAGADANTTICVAGTPASNRGGGAGGSFTGAGGTGGNGSAANAGTPGTPATPPITALRGGCPGQDGQNTAGSGGHGGGAVYLIAGTRIDIGGNGINVGGEAGGGGTQGPSGGGGGGGGAGGMIGLDAPTVMLTGSASVVANGAGGGEGGSGGNTTSGENGTDAITTGAARGGNQNTGSGGDGGNGSAGAAAGPGMPGTNGTPAGGNNGGGGGGGGGAGIIIAPAGTNFGTKASPPATS
jgi:hypothetical protein